MPFLAVVLELVLKKTYGITKYQDYKFLRVQIFAIITQYLIKN